ncbi:hypothetical protein SUGI_0232670 [Cryptomeria japonica]|uniref:ribulose bisphosphate carboxylase/oxygenase activase, chloroplastic n=1 Tax=Cryptomeria japonica TaxID=3369 RepID=UPI0024089B1E|nr:ribulose bisphosphate carboxylase/oxygenase activase, chloroplastic [Cryptomeria japonica]GLJ14403.1 hypothetical protein SUGI_0232670 [Cryptomeria japonica]
MAALRAFVLTPSRSTAISNPKRSQGSKIYVPLSAKNAVSSNSENPNSSSSEEKRVEKSSKKSSQSSWDAKNSEGKDYLYRLGQEADNLNITVGARQGLIDDLFVGNFLGKDADIVFDYRQKVTRSFEHLQGDYYIAPAFMEKIVLHIVKNYMAHLMDISIPLILGVWGGKGQGKSFQTELIFRAMGIEPVIMSAGELESERAGEPGRVIRDRYRTASQVIKNQGKMSCLMINDLDAGVGRFENTQVTVNNQIVIGTLMNLADNPTRVSIGQDWRESDITNRVPIIVTGNDFSTLYAPLIRDGRMEKFYWQPTREDLINIVYRMYQNDGILKDEVMRIVDTFPNQALDFYGALRSRTYDRIVLKWVEDIGGAEKLGEKLLRRRKDDALPPFIPPKQTIENLMEAGQSLIEEQQMVMKMRLSEDYMKNSKT